ncbi:MAG: amino acid ABC transporter permease [Parvibaculaceae bacterium]
MAAVTDERGSARVSYWNDPKVRAIVVQIVVVVLVGWFAWEIIQNTIDNLRSRNIASGFGFLSITSGFDIIQTLVDYSNTSSYGRALIVGLLNTLVMAILGIIAATIIGFVIGIMRLSGNWMIRKIATVYIEVVRNIPLLLQIFVWYALVLKPLPGPKQAIGFLESVFLSNRGLVMPKPMFSPAAWLAVIALAAGIGGAIYLKQWAAKRQEATGEQFPVLWTSIGLIIGLPLLALAVTGFPVTFEFPALAGFNFSGGMTIIPEFIALFLALSIYTASFIAEIVRAGILAVSHGQTEASGALGLRRGPTLRLVVIPQALRVIIPPLTSQYLNLTKNSTLAVAIGYPDLVATGGTVLNQTGQAIEIISIWMMIYLSLSLLTSSLMNWYNARVRLVER